MQGHRAQTHGIAGRLAQADLKCTLRGYLRNK
jgi:hypothetical protein